MEYSLPDANGDQFCNEIMAPLAGIETAPFVTGFDNIIPEEQLPLKALPFIFRRYAEAFDLTLRDQHQVAKILETSIISLKSNRIHIHFLIFLAVLYQKNSSIYRNVTKALSFSENTRFADIFPQNGKGTFMYLYWNGEKDVKKVVQCTEIALTYFNFITSEGGSTANIDPQNFPRNLERHLRTSRTKTSEMLCYIEIVKRAGHFAT